MHLLNSYPKTHSFNPFCMDPGIDPGAMNLVQMPRVAHSSSPAMTGAFGTSPRK